MQMPGVMASVGMAVPCRDDVPSVTAHRVVLDALSDGRRQPEGSRCPFCFL